MNKNQEIEVENIKNTYTGKSENSRSRGIDGLRSFACIAIVCWHVYANGNYIIKGFLFEDIIPSFDFLVYMFMIISGYGMFHGYYQKVKDGTIDFNDFYIRRYSKIWPFFAILVIMDIIMNHSMESVFEGILDLTLVFGFLPNASIGVIGVGWTLGTIFAFYITFPFFCFLLSNKRRAWFSLGISVLIQIVCNIYFMSSRFVIDGFRNRQNILFAAPFFIAGGLIYLYKDKIVSSKKFHMVLIALCVICTMLYYILPYSVVDYKCLLLYSCWVMLAISSKSKLFSNKVTHYISSISMEIYLSHMVIYRIVEKIGILGCLGQGVSSYIFSVLVIVSALLLVLPFIQKLIKCISIRFGMV